MYTYVRKCRARIRSHDSAFYTARKAILEGKIIPKSSFTRLYLDERITPQMWKEKKIILLTDLEPENRFDTILEKVEHFYIM